jgi:lipopolysaccharide export system permease protein
MSRVTRHIAIELLKTFCLTLAAMTTLMVLIFLIQEGWREKLSPEAILKLIPFIVPTALSFAIPGTILFSTCVVYGRMAAQNEIVAIKALGISPSRVIVPGLIIAFLLSLCTVYLNDVAVSWGRRGIYRVILHSSAQTIYGMLNSQGSFVKGKMHIVVDDVQGEELINPYIVRRENDKETSLQIRAERARISVDPVENNLVFRIENGHADFGDHSLQIDKEDIALPLGDVTKKTDSSASPSNLPLRKMSAELTSQIRTLDKSQKRLAIRAASQMLGGNLVGISHPDWKSEVTDLEKQVHRKHRLKTEPWRRWANGFSCLCFVIVGAPLAIRLRKFDFWTNFAVVFIPILLVYYPLMMFGLSQAKSGDLPPWIVWLGNAVMLVAGLWLVNKIEKH